jgi:hypothetical protein
MKVEIWEEQETKEGLLRLRLVQQGSSIALMAVDQDGARCRSGNLLFIGSDGVLHLNRSVNNGLGLKLTGNGYLEVHYE